MVRPVRVATQPEPRTEAARYMRLCTVRILVHSLVYMMVEEKVRRETVIDKRLRSFQPRYRRAVAGTSGTAVLFADISLIGRGIDQSQQGSMNACKPWQVWRNWRFGTVACFVLILTARPQVPRDIEIPDYTNTPSETMTYLLFAPPGAVRIHGTNRAMKHGAAQLGTHAFGRVSALHHTQQVSAHRAATLPLCNVRRIGRWHSSRLVDTDTLIMYDGGGTGQRASRVDVITPKSRVLP